MYNDLNYLSLSEPYKTFLTLRSSCPEVFCKIDVLMNFAKFTGKHLCQSIFFNKVAGLGCLLLLYYYYQNELLLLYFLVFHLSISAPLDKMRGAKINTARVTTPHNPHPPPPKIEKTHKRTLRNSK